MTSYYYLLLTVLNVLYTGKPRTWIGRDIGCQTLYFGRVLIIRVYNHTERA